MSHKRSKKSSIPVSIHATTLIKDSDTYNNPAIMEWNFGRDSLWEERYEIRLMFYTIREYLHSKGLSIESYYSDVSESWSLLLYPVTDKLWSSVLSIEIGNILKERGYRWDHLHLNTALHSVGFDVVKGEQNGQPSSGT